jgi:hypothetical protein
MVTNLIFMKKRAFLIIFVILGILILLFFHQEEGNVKVEEIVITDSYSLYLKRKVWGMTGDHSLTVLSENSEQQIENSKLHFSTNIIDPIFYKVKKDTLFIYSSALFKNSHFFDEEVKIVQREMTSKEMTDMYANYAKYGFNKF